MVMSTILTLSHDVNPRRFRRGSLIAWHMPAIDGRVHRIPARATGRTCGDLIQITFRWMDTLRTRYVPAVQITPRRAAVTALSLSKLDVSNDNEGGS